MKRFKNTIRKMAIIYCLFNATVAVIYYQDASAGNFSKVVDVLRDLSPLNGFQIFAGMAGYNNYSPPTQFTRYFPFLFAVVALYLHVWPKYRQNLIEIKKRNERERDELMAQQKKPVANKPTATQSRNLNESNDARITSPSIEQTSHDLVSSIPYSSNRHNGGVHFAYSNNKPMYIEGKAHGIIKIFDAKNCTQERIRKNLESSNFRFCKASIDFQTFEHPQTGQLVSVGFDKENSIISIKTCNKVEIDFNLSQCLAFVAYVNRLPIYERASVLEDDDKTLYIVFEHLMPVFPMPHGFSAAGFPAQVFGVCNQASLILSNFAENMSLALQGD